MYTVYLKRSCDYDKIMCEFKWSWQQRELVLKFLKELHIWHWSFGPDDQKSFTGTSYIDLLKKDIPKTKKFLDDNGLQINCFAPASFGESKLGIYNVTL